MHTRQKNPCLVLSRIKNVCSTPTRARTHAHTVVALLRRVSPRNRGGASGRAKRAGSSRRSGWRSSGGVWRRCACSNSRGRPRWWAWWWTARSSSGSLRRRWSTLCSTRYKQARTPAARVSVFFEAELSVVSKEEEEESRSRATRRVPVAFGTRGYCPPACLLLFFLRTVLFCGDGN